MFFSSSRKLTVKETLFKKLLSHRNTLYSAFWCLPIFYGLFYPLGFDNPFTYFQMSVFYIIAISFTGFILMPWKVERYIVFGGTLWNWLIQRRTVKKHEDMILGHGFWLCPLCKYPNKRTGPDISYSPCYSIKNKEINICGSVLPHSKVYPYRRFFLYDEL